MGEFVFGLLLGAIIGVVACLIAEVQEAKHIEKRLDKTTEETEKHYLLNDPTFPITVNELETYLADKNSYVIKQVLEELDRKGCVEITTNSMKVPQFSYLFTETHSRVFLNTDLVYVVEIMTQKYWEEQI